jgi:hypothetical protein
MKKILNSLFLTFVLVSSFVVVFPKDKLYSLLQNELLTYNITLESKDVASKPFSLNIQNSDVFLSGSKILSIQMSNIGFFGADFEGIVSHGTFKDMIPNIKNINVSYSIGEFAKASGNFGEVKASLNLSDKKIIIEAAINQATKNKYAIIFAKFNKSGDKYVYEFSF